MFFPEIGTSQHFFRTLEGELSDVATHDMGQFAHTLLWSQLGDNGHGAVVKDLLVDVIVCIGKGSDLWQVGNTDDLVVSSELPELLTDDLTAASADACIDFIKNESRCCICTGENGFEREHEA